MVDGDGISSLLKLTNANYVNCFLFIRSPHTRSLFRTQDGLILFDGVAIETYLPQHKLPCYHNIIQFGFDAHLVC